MSAPAESITGEGGALLSLGELWRRWRRDYGKCKGSNDVDNYNGLGTMTPKQMGRRLQTVREARGLTRQEVAERAKVSREYVRMLEAGRQDPNVGGLQRLAKGLGVKVTKLLD